MIDINEMAKNCYKAHKSVFEKWSYGGIQRVWLDENGVLCVQYASGAWWHYQFDQSNNVIWW